MNGFMSGPRTSSADLRRSGGSVRRVATILFAAMFWCAAAQAQLATVEARLMGRLDSRRLTDGAPFFVKTVSPWKDGRCALKVGATLEGQVTHVQRRGPGAKQEELQLRLLPILCSGDETRQLMPLLVAIEAPTTNVYQDNIAQAALTSAFGAMVGSHSPRGGASAGVRDIQTTTAVDLRAQAVQLVNQPLRAAEVRGFSGVKLSLPTLVSDPTGVSSAHSLLFDVETRFSLVLRTSASVATPSAPSQAAVATATITASPAKPPLSVLPEDADVEKCVESGCALVDSNTPLPEGKRERTLPLRVLGYRSRSNRILRSLQEDAAVCFLGEDQLLVTFNAHPLIRRTQDEADRANGPRMIRALVLSVPSGKVLHSEEWRVDEPGPYLWPLNNGTVLTHAGGSLTVYGPSLAVEQQWTPPGVVRSLRISPSRHLIAAIVEHERHTLDQHRRLATFLGPDRTVEEDYDLTVLDGELHLVGTKQLEGVPDLPAILDSGMIRMDAATRQRWTLQETGWDGKEHRIVRVTSSCPLRVDTLPTNLILLAGCEGDGLNYWYKVVRQDGKTLLAGHAAGDSWVESADAPRDGNVFAIGIAHASRRIDFIEGMAASDFESVAVSVYRGTDGRRVYATQTGGGAVNRQSFALSDTGAWLAVLSGEDVSLYRVEGKRQVAGTALGPAQPTLSR